MNVVFYDQLMMKSLQRCNQPLLVCPDWFSLFESKFFKFFCILLQHTLHSNLFKYLTDSWFTSIMTILWPSYGHLQNFYNSSMIINKDKFDICSCDAHNVVMKSARREQKKFLRGFDQKLCSEWLVQHVCVIHWLFHLFWIMKCLWL